MRFGGGIGRQCADGLVAAGIFGFVEGAVGEGEDFLVVDVDGGSHIPRERGPADGDGAMQRKARAFYFERFASDGGENASSESRGFFAFAEAGNDQEFFAAPTDKHIGIADGGADAGGEVNEHLIAGIVAEAVVDLFVVVGVNQIENDVAIAAAARGVG